MLQSYNPSNAETLLVWAIPLSLATTKGITFVFFASAYLDVSVQRVGLHIGYHTFSMMGFPIRKSSDRKMFALPRSLSQLTTSFFASESLGIRHALLIAFKYL